MTDILDLEGWTPTNKHTDGDEYVIEAEYTVPPKACTKCGNIGNLYKHGPNYRLSTTHTCIDSRQGKRQARRRS